VEITKFKYARLILPCSRNPPNQIVVNTHLSSSIDVRSSTQSIANRGRIVVTGAMGCIGQNIVPMLNKAGWNLHLSDKATGQVDGLDVEAVDLTSKEEVYKLVQGASAVVHLAIARPQADEESIFPESEAYRKLMFDVNIGGTTNLFEAMRENGVKRMVFVSSITTMLGVAERDSCPTDGPARPSNIYACTKLFGENMAWVYHLKCSMQCYCLRIGQPFPIGHEKENDWIRSNIKSPTTSVFALFPDISRAVEAALLEDTIPYAVVNVVSASTESEIDMESGKRIGFFPQEDWRQFASLPEPID